MTPVSNDDLRRLLEQPRLTDKEIDEFRADLARWLNTFLDDYFRGAFDADNNELGGE